MNSLESADVHYVDETIQIISNDHVDVSKISDISSDSIFVLNDQCNIENVAHVLEPSFSNDDRNLLISKLNESGSEVITDATGGHENEGCESNFESFLMDASIPDLGSFTAQLEDAGPPPNVVIPCITNHNLVSVAPIVTASPQFIIVSATPGAQFFSDGVPVTAIPIVASSITQVPVSTPSDNSKAIISSITPTNRRKRGYSNNGLSSPRGYRRLPDQEPVGNAKSGIETANNLKGEISLGKVAKLPVFVQNNANVVSDSAISSEDVSATLNVESTALTTVVTPVIENSTVVTKNVMRERVKVEVSTVNITDVKLKVDMLMERYPGIPRWDVEQAYRRCDFVLDRACNQLDRMAMNARARQVLPTTYKSRIVSSTPESRKSSSSKTEASSSSQTKKPRLIFSDEAVDIDEEYSDRTEKGLSPAQIHLCRMPRRSRNQGTVFRKLEDKLIGLSDVEMTNSVQINDNASLSSNCENCIGGSDGDALRVKNEENGNGSLTTTTSSVVPTTQDLNRIVKAKTSVLFSDREGQMLSAGEYYRRYQPPRIETHILVPAAAAAVANEKDTTTANNTTTGAGDLKEKEKSEEQMQLLVTKQASFSDVARGRGRGRARGRPIGIKKEPASASQDTYWQPGSEPNDSSSLLNESEEMQAFLYLKDAFPYLKEEQLHDELVRYNYDIDQCMSALVSRGRRNKSNTSSSTAANQITSDGSAGRPAGGILHSKESRSVHGRANYVVRTWAPIAPRTTSAPPIGVSNFARKMRATLSSSSDSIVTSKKKFANASFGGGGGGRGDAAEGEQMQVICKLEPDEDEKEVDEVVQSLDEERVRLLAFFNNATREELTVMSGCSKRKAEALIKLRPFDSMHLLVSKLESAAAAAAASGHAGNNNSSLIPAALVQGARELLGMRNVVTNLMAKCERISRNMQARVEKLTQQTTVEDNEAATIKRQPAILNSEMKLKPYQLVGLNWLRLMFDENVNAILADEMGLGKTVQTIAFLAQLLEEGITGPHLVIVPSSTLENWRREFFAWCPCFGVCVYHGNQEERKAIRMGIYEGTISEFNIMLTTYNVATGALEDRAMMKNVQFMYGVFDEAHMLKNMTSQRYRYLMNFRLQKRILLTGTPLQNNLVELMSLLSFVMPDMFSKNQDLFKKMFQMVSRSNDSTTDANASCGDEKQSRSQFESERIAHAKRLMAPFILRRLKSQVLQQLPSKTNVIERVTLPTEQRTLYNDLVVQLRNRFKQDDATVANPVMTLKAGVSVNMLMQLRKAANHPLLHRSHYNNDVLHKMAKNMLKEPNHTAAKVEFIYEDMAEMSDYELHRTCKLYPDYIGEFSLSSNTVCNSGKLEWLDTHLPKFKEAGDRVLLFSQFCMVLDILEEYLRIRKHTFLRLDGSTPVNQRQLLIDKFNENASDGHPTHFVFLLSTRAGGLGINLSAANVVILHDIDFNPYNDKQAEDRCHRVGQTREVRVIRLIAESTVEDGMVKIANHKLQLEEDLTGRCSILAEEEDGQECASTSDISASVSCENKRHSIGVRGPRTKVEANKDDIDSIVDVGDLLVESLGLKKENLRIAVEKEPTALIETNDEGVVGSQTVVKVEDPVDLCRGITAVDDEELPVSSTNS